ncbi:MAG: hypothetical protein COA42_11585 [Alteromonadaceae bacterium]|nr:MAG: hypothetical protein COA42_11585 [Alteromonadaceae bacterium]
MKLVTRPTKKAKPRANKKLSLEEQFQHEWDKIQKQQKQNDTLRTKVKALYERVEGAIRAEEEALSVALYAKIERLIDFYSRKSLTRWQRSELFEWIRESINDLNSQPFSGHLDIDALVTAFGEQLDLIHGPDEDETDEDEDDLFERASAAKNTEGEAGDTEFDDDDFDDEDDFEGTYYEQFYQERFAEQQDAQDLELKRLDQLLKSSSINKMFRRIAAIIHPDKEQDEQLKLEKTAKMAELIEARSSKDIPKIFALYATYVGEPPLDLVDGDMAAVLQLLKHQLSQLKQQSEEIIHEDLMHGAVYERFNSRSNKKIDDKIQEHVAAVRRERISELEFVASTTSLKKLDPVLRERQEQSQSPGFMGAMVDGIPF